MVDWWFMPASDVVILSAARTPIGKYGGVVQGVHPAELGAVAARAAIERAGADRRGHRRSPDRPRPAGRLRPQPRHVRSGHRAGVPASRSRADDQQGVRLGPPGDRSGAQSIMLGESDIVLAGGIESMSRMPYLIDAVDARWGHRMGNFTLVDAMYRDGFQCPLSNLIMGETAEMLAREYGITREQSDCFALESQRKAEGRDRRRAFFTRDCGGDRAARGPRRPAAPATVIERDEHPRETTLESLRKLPPVFGEVEGHPGIITAGTSSGITDGGAALVLASAEAARARGLRPRAKILGWASAGVDPRVMGIGPVPAIEKLRERTGLGIDDFDLVELNEAFAPQVLAVLRDVPVAADRLNVNGGAIALGHPIGATGARIVVTLLHELERRARAPRPRDALRQRRHGHGARDRKNR